MSEIERLTKLEDRLWLARHFCLLAYFPFRLVFASVFDLLPVVFLTRRIQKPKSLSLTLNSSIPTLWFCLPILHAVLIRGTKVFVILGFPSACFWLGWFLEMKSSLGKLKKLALHRSDFKDKRHLLPTAQLDELAQAAQVLWCLLVHPLSFFVSCFPMMRVLQNEWVLIGRFQMLGLFLFLLQGSEWDSSIEFEI